MIISTLFNRFFLSSFTFILKRLNTPQNLLTLFTSLFTIGGVLIQTVGFIPTFRVFWNMRNLTFRNTNLSLFLNRITNGDPYVINQIIQTLTPHFTECLDNVHIFKRINKILIFYFLLRFKGVRGFKK